MYASARAVMPETRMEAVFPLKIVEQCKRKQGIILWHLKQGVNYLMQNIEIETETLLLDLNPS